MPDRYYLVGGENLIDMLAQPESGEYPTFRAVPGGSPLNVAKALARMNANVGYLTPVSTDPMGQVLADHLINEGVGLLAPRSDRSTALALVTLKDGQPEYQFYRTDTADRDVSVTMLNQIIPRDNVTAFHIGSLALASGRDAKAWAQMLVAMKKRGVFTSLDPNIRPNFIKNRQKYLARLERVAAHSDVIKLSDEDMAWISPGIAPEKAAQALFETSGTALLVLTMGKKGAMAFHNSGGIMVSAAPVRKFKDAVGAGDTFCAALLDELWNQGVASADLLPDADAKIIKSVLSFAAKAAALNCEQVGCNPPYRLQMAGLDGGEIR